MDDGRTLPLWGLSEDSYNAVLYYEKANFDIRLAYNYKGKSASGLIGPDLIRWTDDYGQFDLSAGYQFSENFQVTLKALNITDELATSSTEIAGGSYPWRTYDSGRRINLGARFTF